MKTYNEYSVDVYDYDVETYIGCMLFKNRNDAEHYAKLNQPCVLYDKDRNEIASYGFDEED